MSATSHDTVIDLRDSVDRTGETSRPIDLSRPRQVSHRSPTPFQPRAALSLKSLLSGERRAIERRAKAKHQSSPRHEHVKSPTLSRWTMPKFEGLNMARAPRRKNDPGFSLGGIALAAATAALATAYLVGPEKLLGAGLGEWWQTAAQPVHEFIGESDAGAPEQADLLKPVLPLVAPPPVKTASPVAAPAPVVAAPAPIAAPVTTAVPVKTVAPVATPTKAGARTTTTVRPATMTPASRAAPSATAAQPIAVSASDDLDSIFKDDPPRTSKLTADVIIAGVKENASKGGYCLKAALLRGEITPGSHRLVVDWTIQPDGSVTDSRVSGPTEILHTSMPMCFAAAMRTWKFPASALGAPVKNFPLPFSIK